MWRRNRAAEGPAHQGAVSVALYRWQPWSCPSMYATYRISTDMSIRLCAAVSGQVLEGDPWRLHARCSYTSKQLLHARRLRVCRCAPAECWGLRRPARWAGSQRARPGPARPAPASGSSCGQQAAVAVSRKLELHQQTYAAASTALVAGERSTSGHHRDTGTCGASSCVRSCQAGRAPRPLHVRAVWKSMNCCRASTW